MQSYGKFEPQIRIAKFPRAQWIRATILGCSQPQIRLAKFRTLSY